MSHQRMINTKFWDDSFIVSLDPIEKLLFLYLLTNPLTNIAGLYECSRNRVAFDTGIDKDMVSKIIDERFQGRIHHIKREWIYILKFTQYQNTDNPKIRKGIEEIMSSIPEHIGEEVREIDEKYKESKPISMFGSDFFPEGDKKGVAKIKQQKPTEEESEMIDELIELYKKKIYENTRVTSQSKDKIKVRLREKSTLPEQARFEELKEAIENFSKNKWRMDNNADKGLQFFFRSEEQIVKWLELKKDRAKKKIKL